MVVVQRPQEWVAAVSSRVAQNACNALCVSYLFGVLFREWQLLPCAPTGAELGSCPTR